MDGDGSVSDFKLLYDVLSLLGNIGLTGIHEWRQILDRINLFGLLKSLIGHKSGFPSDILQRLCWMIRDIAKNIFYLNITEY